MEEEDEDAAYAHDAYGADEDDGSGALVVDDVAAAAAYAGVDEERPTPAAAWAGAAAGAGPHDSELRAIRAEIVDRAGPLQPRYAAGGAGDAALGDANEIVVDGGPSSSSSSSDDSSDSDSDSETATPAGATQARRIAARERAATRRVDADDDDDDDEGGGAGGVTGPLRTAHEAPLTSVPLPDVPMLVAGPHECAGGDVEATGTILNVNLGCAWIEGGSGQAAEGASATAGGGKGRKGRGGGGKQLPARAEVAEPGGSDAGGGSSSAAGGGPGNSLGGGGHPTDGSRLAGGGAAPTAADCDVTLATLVIAGVPGQQARVLDESSVLCLPDRRVLGRVEEVFGPVAAPMYMLRVRVRRLVDTREVLEALARAGVAAAPPSSTLTSAPRAVAAGAGVEPALPGPSSAASAAAATTTAPAPPAACERSALSLLLDAYGDDDDEGTADGHGVDGDGTSNELRASGAGASDAVGRDDAARAASAGSGALGRPAPTGAQDVDMVGAPATAPELGHPSSSPPLASCAPAAAVAAPRRAPHQPTLPLIGLDELVVGLTVCVVPQLAKFVFPAALRAASGRGSDASNFYDEEVGAEEIEYSDDEAEAASRAARKAGRAKRSASDMVAAGSLTAEEALQQASAGGGRGGSSFARARGSGFASAVGGGGAAGGRGGSRGGGSQRGAAGGWPHSRSGGSSHPQSEGAGFRPHSQQQQQQQHHSAPLLQAPHPPQGAAFTFGAGYAGYAPQQTGSYYYPPPPGYPHHGQGMQAPYPQASGHYPAAPQFYGHAGPAYAPPHGMAHGMAWGFAGAWPGSASLQGPAPPGPPGTHANLQR